MRAEDKQKHIDGFYMARAKLAETNSSCRKKQLGCVLVFSNGQYIMGHNGPPFPIPRCARCNRKAKDWEGHKDCRAIHAERRVLLDAARNGDSTQGAILYSYMGVPCKDCMLELIAAGISEIVVLKETYYDELSKWILQKWLDEGGRFRVVQSPAGDPVPLVRGATSGAESDSQQVIYDNRGEAHGGEAL